MRLDSEISIVLTTHENLDGIRASIRSIMEQIDYKPSEIILVDSASSESVKERLLEIEDEINNLNLILLDKNRGGGHSRNVGKKEVLGDYVFFMDAGDYIEPDALCKLNRAHKDHKPEIIYFSGYTQIYQSDTRRPADFFLGQKMPTEMLFDVSSVNFNPLLETKPQAWLKLYSVEFLRREQLSFQEISSSNDLAFHVQSTLRCRRALALREYLITYVIDHPHSVSTSKGKSVQDLLSALRESLEFTKEQKNDLLDGTPKFLEFGVDVLHWKSSNSTFSEVMKIHVFAYKQFVLPLVRNRTSIVGLWRPTNILKLLGLLSLSSWPVTRAKPVFRGLKNKKG